MKKSMTLSVLLLVLFAPLSASKAPGVAVLSKRDQGFCLAHVGAEVRGDTEHLTRAEVPENQR